MTELNTTVLNLLGKQVSFSISNGYAVFHDKGTVTDIVLSLTTDPQISIDSEEFYSFSELTEFKILGSDPVGDAFEALITDNKAFIDSLSKPTL
jgi:hypothetical protein